MTKQQMELIADQLSEDKISERQAARKISELLADISSCFISLTITFERISNGNNEFGQGLLSLVTTELARKRSELDKADHKMNSIKTVMDNIFENNRKG